MTPLLAKRLGPDRSFERLYRRHVGDVYRYSLAMLRNPADAEDVTQTTFMNAYRAYRGGERPQAAQRWLIAIAHNVCRQRFRQSQRRVDEVAFDESVAEAATPDSDVPSAEELRRALGHLAFNQRAALVMRELEGRSYAEIAEILDVSTSAVETLIFRARRALREQLEGQLSCPEAEVAVSRQLDGRLPRAERGALRAHLRECEECSALARKLRAQRSAIKALGLVPLPASLGSFFGGGTAAAGGGAALLGGGIAAKAAAFVAASAVVAGAGHEVAQRSPFKAEAAQAPAAEAAAPPPAAAAVPVVRTSPSRARFVQPAPAAAGKKDRSGVGPAAPGRSAKAAAPGQAKKTVPPGQAKPKGSAGGQEKKARPDRPVRDTPPRAKKPVKAAPAPKASRRPAKPKPQKPPRPEQPGRPDKPSRK